MKIDFTEVRNHFDKVGKITAQVVESYSHAQWEDEVRDSYNQFISQCKEIENEIRLKSKDLEEVERLANNVEDSSDVKHELDDIKNQADSITI